ncbi:ABC transporter permease [Rhodoluna sp.]|uniref:ABC transporter permease n=1 Tax=Rhodoluna sp. TaxID=1969481 RepID=UPI0025EA6094|nr:ABC transporter permease [Rhodoluna sp.]
MSLIGATYDSAIAIAERRSGKLGSNLYVGRSSALLERNLLAVRSSTWLTVFSGFVEPVFYLLAFGLGLGNLIGGVTDGSGHPVSYAAFIAPALLATSAMNGAIYDSTWNVFFKMHFQKFYNTVLSTSMGPLDVALGEISWGLLRGLAYAIGFMAVITPMGLVPSWWGILAIPASLLVAFGFSSFGMAVTSYFKSFQQMNWLNIFMLPMFLFSGTFYPLSVYPEWLQSIIQAFPLWQAVEMIRALCLGQIGLGLLSHVIYFVVMISIGLVFTTRRLTALFMR